MPIVRVIKDKNNPYMTVNKYYIHDNRLSLKAKGLMSYFLSRPDNWEFYVEEIMKHTTDKETSITSAIKELLNCGYIQRQAKRNTDGKFKGGYDYEIYEVPLNQFSEETTACIEKKPKLENPESGKTRIGKIPNRENHGLLNNELKLNNDINSSSSKGNMEVFKHFEKCNFGLISPILMEKIAADIEIYSKEWVMKAAECADESGKHNYNYVKGILGNWKANGGIKEKKEVKCNGNTGNYKKNTGGHENKWGGYKAPTPKLTGKADTTGLI